MVVGYDVMTGLDGMDGLMDHDNDHGRAQDFSLHFCVFFPSFVASFLQLQYPALKP